MDSTGDLSAKQLVALIAPPRTIKAMINEVAKATGLHPRIVEGAWHGEQTSKRAVARLRQIAERKTLLAEAIEPGGAADRALADSLRGQARGFHSAADRG